jgi:hypothetical protein
MQAQQTQPSALEPHLSACHAVPMSSLESQVGERRRRCFAVSTPFNEELRKPPPPWPWPPFFLVLPQSL